MGDLPAPPLVKMIDEDDPFDSLYAFPSKGLVGVGYPDGTVYPLPGESHVELTCPSCVNGIFFHVQIRDANDKPNRASFSQTRKSISSIFDTWCHDGKGMSCGIQCPWCTKFVRFAWRMSAGYKFPTQPELDSGVLSYPAAPSTNDVVDMFPTMYDMEKSQSSSDSESSSVV
jgi:hypothetical protein